MCTDLIVIASVLLQHATQLRFVEHDQVIESFAPNRADEALDVAVLPRRARCGWVIPDPHCPNAAGVGWAEGSVAIAKQMIWCFVPRKGVSHLTCDPLVCSGAASVTGSPCAPQTLPQRRASTGDQPG